MSLINFFKTKLALCAIVSLLVVQQIHAFYFASYEGNTIKIWNMFPSKAKDHENIKTVIMPNFKSNLCPPPQVSPLQTSHCD